MREVESQQVGVDLRSLLHGVAAEEVLQRGMEQMRGRVGPPESPSPGGVYPGRHGRTEIEPALVKMAEVQQEASFPLCVPHLEPTAWPGEHADVADLTADSP